MSFKIFVKKTNLFISNDISKTRRFYEFILVDTESIQVSHFKNPKGTDIAYSKCKILKIFLKKTRNKVLLHTKGFLKTLFLKLLIILNTKMHGLTHSPTLGFSIGEKILKNLFQIGFRNGGYFLEPIKIFFVLKFTNTLTISKPIVKTFSLLEIVIHFLFVLNLESLGFFVGNSPPIISCLHHFPSI